ncbi:MAG: hypothetical protein JW814_04690 [Candidatus Krumholzibacteriota bacterium]|nr:hypothetical protein [Candidatus Krumholzibacteriota bacterium]
MKKSVLFALILILASHSAMAMPTRLLNYQGVLLGSGGSVAEEGYYDITFRIYDILYEGSPLWEETDNVFVSNGIFALTLGTVTPLALPFDDVYYIAMSVDGGEELSPRNILTSTPYSYSSMNVWGTDNIFPSTGNVGIGTASPGEKLEVAGAIKIGTASGAQAGTIRWNGGDFEGYDGGSWVSLTSTGGSALPAGSSGATLRHNGSEWTSSTRIYNDGTSVGIGTSSPEADLHLYASNSSDLFVESANASGIADLLLKTPGGIYDYFGFFKYGASAAGSLGGISTMNLSALTAGTAAGALLMGTQSASPIHFLTDSAERLRIESDGDVNLVSDGSVTASSYSNTNGGALEIYSETGARNFALQPDANGSGGYFGVARNNSSSYGFRVDGSYNGTEEPYVTITGSLRSASFNMSSTGNASVALPVGSISSTEMADEPGVASYGTSGGATLPNNFVFVFGSCTITTPDVGYVFVIASGNVTIDHTYGTESLVFFGVSDNTTAFQSDQEIPVRVPEDAPSGMYNFPLTSHTILEANAPGSNTYYMIGQRASGGVIGFFDYRLSCVFIPTTYGTVSASSGSYSADDIRQVSQPLTEADIADERARAIEANAERIQRELDAMKAELEAIRREGSN